MDKFEWLAKYETGIKIIDEQHKGLFVQMDALILSIYRGDSRRELAKSISFLENYVIEHFETDEEIMMSEIHGRH